MRRHYKLGAGSGKKSQFTAAWKTFASAPWRARRAWVDHRRGRSGLDAEGYVGISINHFTSPIKRKEPDMKQLEGAKIDEFKTHFRGEMLLPGDPGYDEVRQIWNAMVDRTPGVIARCASPDDVVQAVRFASQNDALASIRGGGDKMH